MSVFAGFHRCARAATTKGSQCVGIAACKNATVKPVTMSVMKTASFISARAHDLCASTLVFRSTESYNTGRGETKPKCMLIERLRGDHSRGYLHLAPDPKLRRGNVLSMLNRCRSAMMLPQRVKGNEN